MTTPSRRSDVASTCSPRTRLDHDERRANILRAAQHLFAHQPYESVSIGQIAEASGTTRTNLHYYFGSKQDLYLEVVEQFAHLPLTIPPATSSQPKEEVRLLLGAWLDLVEANAETFRALIRTRDQREHSEVGGVLVQSQLRWEQRLLEAAQMDADSEAAHAAVRAYQAFLASACEQWLGDHSLTKQQVLDLLTAALIAIAESLT
ncbi:TetR/AcrR family transcriptional regulator [Nocardia sp. NPDC057272]|uniref:TetR/AcrR family transcriptional regulator n=1 Tax=Nocardia sp. NPDC057272 TaxID=3346079 RepID=UPI0036381EB2